MLALAWAAGLIDGEGCVTIIRANVRGRKDLKTKTRFSLMLKVSMGDRKAVYRLRRIFGYGNVKYYPAPPRKRLNGHYSWTVESKKALYALKAVRPFLITKGREADLAMAFMRLPVWQPGGHGGSTVTPAWLLKKRNAMYWEMRKLKPRWRFRKAA